MVCALLLRSRPGSTVVIMDQLDRPRSYGRCHPFQSQEIYPNHSIPISYLKYRTISGKKKHQLTCGGATRFVAILSLHFYGIWIHHDTPMAPLMGSTTRKLGESPFQATRKNAARMRLSLGATGHELGGDRKEG